jgi:mannose-6-phosphate isomerase-like protein (cupin superfamily)
LEDVNLKTPFGGRSMKDISAFIQSGIIEAYVLGMASPEETKEVEEVAVINAEVKSAIDTFSDALESQALASAIAPDPTIKPFLMASIDFIDRVQKGEVPGNPPSLTTSSRLADFAEWLYRPDFVLPGDFKDVYAKIIAHTPAVTTAVVWLKELAPQEVHHDEYEKFLIAEGTCDIIIEGEVHHLAAGDFLAIPLFKKHHLVVTSKETCKAILQRVAA